MPLLFLYSLDFKFPMKKLVYIVLILFAVSASAQSSDTATVKVSIAPQVDFTGTWKLNYTKTDFGQAPKWILPSGFTVKQGKESVLIVSTLLDTALAAHFVSETLPFNGQAVTTTIAANVQRTASLHWPNPNSFVISSTATNEGKPGNQVTDSWALTDGGKTLILDRKVIQSNGFTYTSKAFFDKQ